MSQAEQPAPLQANKALANSIRSSKRKAAMKDKITSKRVPNLAGSLTRRLSKQLKSGMHSPKASVGEKSDHSGSRSVTNQLNNFGFNQVSEAPTLGVVEERTEQKDQSRVNIIGNEEDSEQEFVLEDEDF